METDMKNENQASQGCSANARPGEASAKAPPGLKPVRRKKVAVLDMGEASREQGFRLNGCR